MATPYLPYQLYALLKEVAMKWTKWIAMSVAVMLFSGARAEEPSAASVASQEWRSYVSPLEPIGERLAGQLSDQNDAQLRQDMYAVCGVHEPLRW